MLDLSTDKLLQSAAGNERGGSNTENRCGLIVDVIIGLGLFIGFVFGCIALTHSNDDAVIEKCGHGLRDWVLAHVCIYSVFFVLGCVTSFVVGGCLTSEDIGVRRKGHICSTVWYFVWFIVFIIDCIYMFIYSDEAVHKPNCISALESHSAGLGSPLLARMGYVFCTFDIIGIVIFYLFMYHSCILRLVENPPKPVVGNGVY